MSLAISSACGGRWPILVQRHVVLGLPISTRADFASPSQANAMVSGTVQRTGLNTLIGRLSAPVLQLLLCSILALKVQLGYRFDAGDELHRHLLILINRGFWNLA